MLVGIFMFNFACVQKAEAFSFIDKIWDLKEEIIANIIPNSQTANLLKSVLNLNPTAGQGGGDLTIVDKSALLPVVGPNGSLVDIESKTPASDRISVYVVREGDSLSGIAKMFGVSVNTIIWANDITRGDLIKIGQELIILPVTGLKYIVKEKDTVASIAKKFKADADEIIDFNNLSLDGGLVVGDEIIIPDGDVGYTPTLSYPSSSNPYRGGSGPIYAGYYLKPVEGGRRTQGLHGYNAVDLASYCGAPVLAAASGDVIISRSYGWNGGYGNYVVISHLNGTQTLYAHLGQNIVSNGWHVVQGQVIGYEGSTGKSSGCHVHFEVRGARNPF